MKNIELESAVDTLVAHCQISLDNEKVRLLDALGRVSAEDVLAKCHQPPFDRSPLDGYAIRGEDTVGAETKTICLQVIDEACAGHVSQRVLGEGKCVRIMTGAPMPKGSNAVIRQEDTDRRQDEVLVHKEIRPNQNYCYAGEDFITGEPLLKEGERIEASHIGLLASNGMTEVTVKSKLRVGVMSTGDELIEPGQSLAPGKIYNSNLYTLSARLLALGCEPVLMGTVHDDTEACVLRIEAFAEKTDLILTTGGVSVGKKDIMHPVFKALEIEALFWRIRIKPGTPVLAGMYGKTMLLCLSGNPSAAAVTFELLFRPLLSGIYCSGLDVKKTTAIAGEGFKKSSSVRRFVKAFIKDGKVFLTRGNHSSGALKAMVGCNCLIEIEAGRSLDAGEEVKIVLV